MQNIYNKLAKNKKVKLNAIDDIRTELERLQDISGLASYYAYDRFDEIIVELDEFKTNISVEVDNLAVNSEINYPEELFRDLEEIMNPIKNYAELMGIDASEIAPEYAEAMQFMDDYRSIYDDFVSKYKEVVRDSGFLPDFL